VQTPTTD